MYFEDCECLLFLFLNIFCNIDVALSLQKAPFLCKKRSYFGKYLALQELLHQHSLKGTSASEFLVVLYISIPQDLFHAFYPDLLPAYL